MTLSDFDFAGLSALDLRARLLAGELSLAGVVEAFIDEVGDDDLHAWACVDREQLHRQAAALSALDRDARARLPLFGVPVGIKDVFDTVDLPTAYGSPIYDDHRPDADAAVVTRLRAAGALIAGKTKCAEFAWMTPPDTLNPLDRARTPGGSSNGSAAAVAAGHVPLATGSQTAGSINRPASYCGVVGFKPSFGRYDRAGIKLMSDTLDTAGLLARSVDDLLLADAALTGKPVAPEPASAPRIGFVRTPMWERVEPHAADMIELWVDRARRANVVDLGEPVLPELIELAEAQEGIQRYESARSLAPELASDADRLSPALREALIAGSRMPRREYESALAIRAEWAPRTIDALRLYDAILTPSATGLPPRGLEFTGDPLFCRAWTLIGAPSLSVPLVWTPGRLPIGLQLVAAPGDDIRLLHAARHVLAPHPVW